MNLVFVTRIVDRQDTRSGFVFDWIEALADEVDRLYVICLEKGDVSGLPANVEVGSMGKEEGNSRLHKLTAYWGFLVDWLPQSKGVLVHMHPLYAIAAWPLTTIYGKKMGLWYTHKQVDGKLKLAHAMVDVVFTASTESFRLPSNKARVMGHGINMGRFSRTMYEERGDNVFRIVSLGRISLSKDYETMVLAMRELVKASEANQAISYRLDIYGDPALEQDEVYLDNLLEMTEGAGLDEVISFHPGVPYGEVPELYARGDLFINLSQTGSMDKTVLEAAASKTLVLTSNEAYYRPLLNISPMLVADNNEPKELAAKIKALKDLPQAERDTLIQRLYEWVKGEHDIKQLATRLVGEYGV